MKLTPKALELINKAAVLSDEKSNYRSSTVTQRPKLKKTKTPKVTKFGPKAQYSWI